MRNEPAVSWWVSLAVMLCHWIDLLETHPPQQTPFNSVVAKHCRDLGKQLREDPVSSWLRPEVRPQALTCSGWKGLPVLGTRPYTKVAVSTMALLWQTASTRLANPSSQFAECLCLKVISSLWHSLSLSDPPAHVRGRYCDAVSQWVDTHDAQHAQGL